MKYHKFIYFEKGEFKAENTLHLLDKVFYHKKRYIKIIRLIIEKKDIFLELFETC